MKRLFWVLALIALAPVWAQNPALTPGALDPRVTQENIQQTICVSGYTKTVRPPVRITNKMKVASMAEYGITGSARDFEFDHLIPLCLGGCPDCRENLWPQAWPEARQKDKLEVRMQRMVCRGAIGLAEAQVCIARDWRACAAKVNGNLRPVSDHPIRCPKHGLVYMRESEYLDYLASGPLQDLTAALAHQIDPRNPDPPRRKYKIRCPICKRVAQRLETKP